MDEEKMERAERHQMQSRRDRRRHDLVVAAYQLLAERGFEGLRVRDVAALVGVNIATLHYYFPTKDELVQAVVDYLLQQFIDVTAPLPEGYQDTPPEQLRQVFVDLGYQVEQVPEMFVVLNELHLHAQRNPGVHTSLERLNAGWQAHIEGICAEGIRQRLFRPELDARWAASMVIALVKGISLQVVSKLETFDFEQTGERVVQWFLKVQ